MGLICVWFVRLLTTIVAVDGFKLKETQSYLPRKFLVSLDSQKSLSLEAFQEHLDALGVKHQVLHDFTQLVPEVFYGVSVELSDEDDVKYLKESAHVEKISQIRVIRPSNTFNQKIMHDPVNATYGFPPHIQTRVSELHRMGIYGQGVKVALIDSGIDCTHPALGNGFGPGFKIAFGRSFVEDDDDDDEKQDSFKPRNNALHFRSVKHQHKKIKSPCTPCAAHGTHVAGIVAAADAGYGFTGVAPNVTLGMYRVFGCGSDSGTTNDLLMAAVLQAYKDGADIISASIGGPGGWGIGDELSNAISKLIQQKGAIVTVAAGNEGSEGLFFGDNPASGKNVISVGSVDADAIVAGIFKASTGKELQLLRTSSFNLSGEHSIYLTTNSMNDTSDACEELPKETPNLANYVVLIKRGTCLFSVKAKNAAAHGAKFILFYMNSTSVVTLSNTLANASVAPISFEDGKYIFDQVKKDRTGFKVSFPPTKHFYVKTPNGGLMSNFSQYGPSFDFLSPQPAVSAVGGNVVSTYPVKQGSYASLSGTSMATPQLAGISALILSARGKKFDGLALRARLATSTKLLAPYDKSGIETVVHQGGGLIDAFCAVWTNTSISTPTLALNDSSFFRRNHEFTIFNNGTSTIEYVLYHRPARTVSTFSSKTKYHRPDVKLTLSDDTATALINPRKFSLQPGSSQVVKVDFTPPSHSDPQFLPVYSGYIVMVGNVDCESHNVPYYGVLGSLKNQPIIDRGPDENKTVIYPYLAYPRKKSLRNDTKRPKIFPLTTPFVWDLQKHNSTVLHFRTLFGSPIVRADVLAGDANLSNKTSNCDFEKMFRGTPLLGLVPDSDNKALSRSGIDDSWTQKWNGTFLAHGKKTLSFLPNGSYKLLLRALRVTGRKENDGDYDYWLSPKFTLKNSPVKKN